jgi:membrane associated rhomboid family serine protease
VERRLGTTAFVRLYSISGVGAGLASFAVVQIAAPGAPVTMVGASGAIFGVLIAFAMLFPYRPVTLLVFFVLPVTMQARWLVAVFAFIEALTLMRGGGVHGLGHLAHLSGLVFGWAYLKSPAWSARWVERARRRRVERQMRIVRAGYAERDRLQAEVDALLDKISREGMRGLSDAERRRLVQASEELRKL